jgi:pimeloyl-ACP methyl ester carboxylesterase
MLAAACCTGTANAQFTTTYTAPTRVDTAGMSAGGSYYQISGKPGADWVVLIHGFGVDLHMWDPQMAVLNANFRVLRYDLPSHGKSPTPPEHQPGWRDLAFLLDQLKIPAANIVGLSAGANIAVDFAVVSPERVERLVLASPNIDGYTPKENMMAWFGPIAAQARAGHPDSAAAMFARSPLLRLWSNPGMQATLTALVMANARVWTDTLPRGAPLTPPALAQLGKIASPTLVIVGGHDGVDTKAIADTIVKSVKGATHLVFPNSGHVLNMDQPAKFDSALVKFLGPRGVP